MQVTLLIILFNINPSAGGASMIDDMKFPTMESCERELQSIKLSFPASNAVQVYMKCVGTHG